MGKAKRKAAEEAFISALAARDVVINDLSDLARYTGSLRHVLPLLLDTVQNSEHEDLKLWVTRALDHNSIASKTVPWMLAEFRDTTSSVDSYRWTLGDSIERQARRAPFEEIASLAADRSFGTDRGMLVLSLAKFRREEVKSLLTDALNDDSVAWYALKALSKRMDLAAELSDQIHAAVRSESPHNRQVAKSILKRLDARSSRHT